MDRTCIDKNFAFYEEKFRSLESKYLRLNNIKLRHILHIEEVVEELLSKQQKLEIRILEIEVTTSKSKSGNSVFLEEKV